MFLQAMHGPAMRNPEISSNAGQAIGLVLSRRRTACRECFELSNVLVAACLLKKYRIPAS